ncbi:MAG: WS/DGAT/MGAT family O-acyltransferase [Acidimicrobiales bacterium]
MDRLTGIDRAFLSLETEAVPLHILGAMILDPTGVDGAFDVGQVRRLIADRLHRIPPFGRRVVPAPLGFGSPMLVEDTDVDLEYHVRAAAIPSPGRTDQLLRFVAELASLPLDRHRPLWELHVVDAMADGSRAVVAKVHHAILDGVSAAEVLGELFDLSARPPPRLLFGPAPSTSPAGGGSALLVPGGFRSGQGAPDGASSGDGRSTLGPILGAVAAGGSLLAGLARRSDELARTAVMTVRTVRSWRSQDGLSDGPLPPLPFASPQTSINRSVSGHRRAAIAELPMAQIDRVRHALGGTVNDVVLSVVSGALRSFFAARNESPATSLVAMVPVSVRTDDERGTFGNKVSAMLVNLSTGVADPVARYHQVRKGARSARDRTPPVVSQMVAGWADAVIPSFVTHLSRLASRSQLFDHLPPPFNVIVSNVHGPDVPLYLAGARLVALYPFGPIVEGVGLNITVFSYGSSVFVGVLGCWDLVPDVHAVVTGMTDALSELLGAVDRSNRPIPWWHAELPA